VNLSRDQQRIFSRPMFSFSHDTTLCVNSTLIGEGIHQSLLTTPKGTLILVQEYDQTNPNDFVEVMLKEITRDEELAGYDVTTSPVTKMVGDKEVSGRRRLL
jgi:hypothetical protein